MSRRVNISSGSPFEETIGFSRAVRVGDRVLVSGTGPVYPDGSCPDSAAAQARRCIEIIGHALEEVGSGLKDVVRTRMYLTSANHAGSVAEVHAAAFSDTRPAATMIVIAELLDPRWKVEIEAEALDQQDDQDLADANPAQAEPNDDPEWMTRV